MTPEEFAAAANISVEEARQLMARGQQPAAAPAPAAPQAQQSQGPLDYLSSLGVFQPLIDWAQPSPEMQQASEQMQARIQGGRPELPPMGLITPQDIQQHEANQPPVPPPAGPTNAPTAAPVDVNQSLAVQPTNPAMDQPAQLVGNSGGTFTIQMGTFGPNGAPLHVSGTPQQIEQQLTALQQEGTITAETARRAIQTLPVGTAGTGSGPMATVQQTLERQIRGQASPDQLAALDAANAGVLGAQHLTDTAQARRFETRGQSLGTLGSLQEQQAAEAQQAALARQQRLQSQMSSFQDAIQRVASNRVDPTAFWGSTGTERFSRGMGAAIAVALSGLGQAFGGGENGALQQIDAAVNRNIEAQRANMQNASNAAQLQGQALAQMQSLFQDQAAAEAATRALHYQAVISRVQQLENGASGAYADSLAKLRDALMQQRNAAAQVASAQAVQATMRTQTTQRVPVGRNGSSGPLAGLRQQRAAQIQQQTSQPQQAAVGPTTVRGTRPGEQAQVGLQTGDLQDVQQRAAQIAQETHVGRAQRALETVNPQEAQRVQEQQRQRSVARVRQQIPGYVTPDQRDAMTERLAAAAPPQDVPAGIRVRRAGQWRGPGDDGYTGEALQRRNDMANVALQMPNLIGDLIHLRDMYGSEQFTTREAAEMQTTKAVLQNMLRQLQGMGTLQEADMRRLAEQAPDPVTLGAQRMFGGSDPVVNTYLSLLNQWGHYVNSTLRNTYGADVENLDSALRTISTPRRQTHETVGQEAGRLLDHVRQQAGF